MPQLAPLTVNDRQATPVAHTFEPRNIQSGVAKLVESNGVPIGDKIVTISSRKTGSKTKVRLIVAVPTVITEVIGGADVSRVSHTAYADVTFTFDDHSSLEERQDVVGMFANMLAADQPLVDGVVTKLEGIY